MEAPTHLTEATRRWWQSIIATHRLPDHKIRLLTMAAESLDRYEQARAIIAREGLSVGTRDGGLKTHPACRIERDARLAFARLMRALALDNRDRRPTGLQVSAIDESSDLPDTAAMKRWP